MITEAEIGGCNLAARNPKDCQLEEARRILLVAREKLLVPQFRLVSLQNFEELNFYFVKFFTTLG